jgi:hypothetical protein
MVPVVSRVNSSNQRLLRSMFAFNLPRFNKSRAEYPSFRQDNAGKMDNASMSDLLHNVWADAREIAKSNPSEGGRSSQEEILGKIGDISGVANGSGSCKETEVQRYGDTLQEKILGESRVMASGNEQMSDLLHNVWADAGEMVKHSPSEGGRSLQEEIIGEIGDISAAANGSCKENEVQRDGGDTEIFGKTQGISAAANRWCEETKVQKDNGDIPMATVSPCSGLEDIWLL